MKVITITGTRPQIIKSAMLMHAFSRLEEVCSLLLHTGQHYDDMLSDVFFCELAIPAPDFNLHVGSGSHAHQTAGMLAGIDDVIATEQPDWVTVIGDTNSTLAGALAAVKRGIPVAHVEAGLRSGDRGMPEEVNRVLTDHVSSLLFTPTNAAGINLEKEGITDGVYQTGDVQYDAMVHFRDEAVQRSQVLERLGLASKSYLLATVHRAKTTDDERMLAAIVGGLCRIARDIPVVLPLHPRTRGAANRFGLLRELERSVKVLEPVSYLDMLALEVDALHICTDSGGVQKEAYFCGVPCSTLRSETEWVELVTSGWNQLIAPTDADAIANKLRSRLDSPGVRQGAPRELYGNGDASVRIADHIASAFN